MEILKGVVWDIQRHAAPTTTSVSLSDLTGAGAQNGQVILYDGSAYSAAASNTDTDTYQTIATFATGTGYTLDDAIVTVIATAAGGPIVAGSSGATIQNAASSATQSFSIDGGRAVTIASYNSGTGYVLSGNLTDTVGLKVTAGSVTTPLTNADVHINDGNNVYTITAATAGDEVTITSGKGVVGATVTGNAMSVVTTNSYAFMGGESERYRRN